MIKRKKSDSAVSIGNKMFVIGGIELTRSEMFDVISRKFTVLKFNHLKNLGSCFWLRAQNLRWICLSTYLNIFDNLNNFMCTTVRRLFVVTKYYLQLKINFFIFIRSSRFNLKTL